MTIKEAIPLRHSVRKYLDMDISSEDKNKILNLVSDINNKESLHFQVRFSSPKAFQNIKAYGSFKNANNYIALICNKNKNNPQEICGYFAEEIMLYLRTINIGSCICALSYSKRKLSCEYQKDDKLIAVIAFGYGENFGYERKSKDAKKVSNLNDDSPLWFKEGVEAALLSPTAINQQNFLLLQDGNEVKAINLGGPCSKIDLGCVKFNFELVAGKENFTWKN